MVTIEEEEISKGEEGFHPTKEKHDQIVEQAKRIIEKIARKGEE